MELKLPKRELSLVILDGIDSTIALPVRQAFDNAWVFDFLFISSSIFSHLG